MRKNKVFLNGWRITLLHLFICLFLASCNYDSKYYNPDTLVIVKRPQQFKQLKSEKILKIDNGNVLDLCCTNQYLIVTTNTPSQFIRIYDLATDSLVSSFGEFGNAANEFEDYITHHYVRYDSNGKALLYVIDCKGLLTKLIDIEESIKRGCCVLRKTYKHPIELSGMEWRNYYIDSDRIAFFKEVSFVGPRDRLYNPPAFGVYNSEMNTTKDLFPNLINNDCINVILGAYSTLSCLSPTSTHIVGMMKFIDVITIMDLSTMKTIGLRGKDSYDFSFLEGNVNKSDLTSELRLYNVDICAGEDCFYVLKENGKTIDELSESKRAMPYVGHIYAYNWEGNIVDSYTISEELLSIAYSSSCKKLFGVDENGLIYKYDFSK